MIYVDCAPLGLACCFRVAAYKHCAPLAAGVPIGMKAVILSPQAYIISLVQHAWFEMWVITSLVRAPHFWGKLWRPLTRRRYSAGSFHGLCEISGLGRLR